MSTELRKHIWYVKARVSVTATIQVVGRTQEEAQARYDEGAWHSVDVKQWDDARSEVFIEIKQGPGLSS